MLFRSRQKFRQKPLSKKTSKRKAGSCPCQESQIQDKAGAGFLFYHSRLVLTLWYPPRMAFRQMESCLQLSCPSTIGIPWIQPHRFPCVLQKIGIDSSCNYSARHHCVHPILMCLKPHNWGSVNAFLFLDYHSLDETVFI